MWGNSIQRAKKFSTSIKLCIALASELLALVSGHLNLKHIAEELQWKKLQKLPQRNRGKARSDN